MCTTHNNIYDTYMGKTQMLYFIEARRVARIKNFFLNSHKFANPPGKIRKYNEKHFQTENHTTQPRFESTN